MFDIIILLIIIVSLLILYFVYNILYKKKQIKQIKLIKIQKIKKNQKNKEKKTNKKNELGPLKGIIKKNKKIDNNYVYLTISTNGEEDGTIKIKLFDDVVPKTCNNFRTLCKQKKYINSPFHRIIKDFMIQGGDYTKGNGTGGISIYGDKFEDENFILKHDRPYLLSMANAGPDTNGSQFFITTSETPHLDGKHVVFGEVIDGFTLIDKLNNVDTNHNDRPMDKIIISNCY